MRSVTPSRRTRFGVDINHYLGVEGIATPAVVSATHLQSLILVV